jgi:hypothetical protein
METLYDGIVAMGLKNIIAFFLSFPVCDFIAQLINFVKKRRKMMKIS